MISISTQMEQIIQPVQLREDEYLEEESKLVYCSKCRTPRQKRLEVFGKIYDPRCRCTCQPMNSGSENESNGSFWIWFPETAVWACRTRSCGGTPLKMILVTTGSR